MWMEKKKINLQLNVIKSVAEVKLTRTRSSSEKQLTGEKHPILKAATYNKTEIESVGWYFIVHIDNFTTSKVF